MYKHTITITVILLVTILSVGVCTPGGDEPNRVSLPVVLDNSKIEVCENLEGWSVELTVFRIAIQNIEFTIEGELHAGLIPKLIPELINGFSEFIIPSAFAHPGHMSGGEVTGELPGNFILDLFAQEQQYLGNADLLVGDYNGINFYFRKADEQDGLAKNDPLLGHTAYLRGIATKGAQSIEFTAVLDELEENTQMVGGSFHFIVSSNTSATLSLQVITVDSVENNTLFDGFDFELLNHDDTGVVNISPGTSEHNILIKTLQTHEHYALVAN